MKPKIPIYIFSEDLMPEVQAAARAEGIQLVVDGAPHKHLEGRERTWKCRDETGDLFHLSACTVNENNALNLAAGTFFLMGGPSVRNREGKEIDAGYDRLERALATLGIKQGFPVREPCE